MELLEEKGILKRTEGMKEIRVIRPELAPMLVNPKAKKFIGSGMSLGILVGAVVSALTGDWASWIPVGLATGLAVGAGRATNAKNQSGHD